MNGPGLSKEERDLAARYIVEWAHTGSLIRSEAPHPEFPIEITMGTLAELFLTAQKAQFKFSQQGLDRVHRKYRQMVEAGGINPETTQALLYGVLLSVALGAIKPGAITKQPVLDLAGLEDAMKLLLTDCDQDCVDGKRACNDIRCNRPRQTCGDCGFQTGAAKMPLHGCAERASLRPQSTMSPDNGLTEEPAHGQ